MGVRVDEEGTVWIDINQRGIPVGRLAALVGQPAPGTGTGVAASGGPCTGADAFIGFLTAAWPRVRTSSPVSDHGVDVRILLPDGRSLIGSELAVQIHAARWVGARVLASVEDASRTEEFCATPVGDYSSRPTTPHHRPGTSFSTRSSGAAGPARRPGGSCRSRTGTSLDDLTFGIVRAVVNRDAALECDDRALVASRRELAAYEPLPASAVSRDAVPGLGPVAQMWLGSDFCARHLLRALPALSGAPTFWTREQHGEEASTWLLFGHKYAYLRQTMTVVGTRAVRSLCVPEDSVRQSSRAERVLLFLAIALMESLGIRTQLTPEPAYRDVKGFMIAATRRQAVIANWVRGEGIWHVDSTGRRAVVRELLEVASSVAASSIIMAPSPAGRLRVLASDLGLKWTWLTSRCAALARSGTAGMVRPRSRLISTAGLDAACAFVGSMGGIR